MKNKALFIVVLLLAAVLAAAVVLYPKLSERYAAAKENTVPAEDIQPDIVEPEDVNPDVVEPEDVDPDIVEPEDVDPDIVEPEDVDRELVPDFTVMDKDGNTAALSDFFGKPIILNFWATWCGPCKSELPAFNSAYEQHGDDITFLMVNLTDGHDDTVESVKAFVENGNYTFPVYFDTEYSAAYAYGVRSIPMTVFINSDGTLMDFRIGAMDETTLGSYMVLLLETN